MKKEKSHIVYMLQLSIYDDSLGFNTDVLIKEWHYNDVFTSIKKAVAVGKKELLRKLKELKSLVFRGVKINEIVENGIVSYEFYVYEFDPDVKRSRALPWYKWDDYTRWDFDYKGKLRSREVTSSCEEDGKIQYSFKVVNPGDEKNLHDTSEFYGKFTMNDIAEQQSDMIYEILPRWKASHATEEIDAPDTAIISIIDPENPENLFNDRAWIKGILRLEFDDVEDDESVDRERYIHMTKEQAQQIVDFACKHYNSVKRFIIHCEAGASRSAAVAVALCEHFEKHDNNIWNDRRYFPNKHVYSLMKAALQEKESK